VPIFGFPQHFRVGGTVVIVQGNNNVAMVFRGKSIDGPQRVRLANGKTRDSGYVIRAARGSIRKPEIPVAVPIHGWHAIGAFRYLDAAKMKAIIVGDDWSSSGEYIENVGSDVSRITFEPHVHGIPGTERNNPEARLVDDYVEWVGNAARFGHNYIRSAGLFVDLFDLTHWRLIEAKSNSSREAIRMAVGQLLDYKRYYDGRHPSLAVLLPEKPSVACRQYVADSKINLIWKTPAGRFSYRAWVNAGTATE